ncbi:MAG: hypothetical protein NZ740_04540 [Kiritimatiellae bacterium]|nr:hypothetical protein [Kiritimatiellia bacterium]MDW8458359.1 hypothetical protein [Verrucomicrobiota bacterium]
MRVPSSIPWLKYLSILIAMAGFYSLAYVARRGIVEAQYRVIGPNLPFTLESALYYRRIKIVHDTGQLPTHDPMVQYPEGINPWRTYTAGAEYVYAALARRFPDSIPFADRLRRIEAGWFSLAIPLVGLGLFWRYRSWTAAAWSMGFYAVSISSVLRSTGLELSHENFAIPLLALHGAALAFSDSVVIRHRRWLAHGVSAAALAGALCTWDLVQYYIGLRLVFRLWRRLRGDTTDRFAAWSEYAALCAVALLNPYHSAQGWGTSSIMALAHGLAISDLVETLMGRAKSSPLLTGRRVVLRLGVILVAFGAISALHERLAPPGAYSHFTDLFLAKIRFLNRKPEDPSLLTFDQRILWVPALNSVTWRDAAQIFPALLVLTFLAIVLLVVLRNRSLDFYTCELIFAATVSAVAYWLFARFHVYLSLFGCMLLGAGWASIRNGSWFLRMLAGGLLGAGLLVEAAHTMRVPERWGRVNVYYKELHELTTWLARHVSPHPVLANFGVSGTIAAYGKCAILLHPKFESADIRNRVREYGEALFLKTEKEFRDWADSLGAKYYVHSFGEFSRFNPELQMRYFVNALHPRPDAAARGFEFDPDNRTWFIPLYRNVKYAVFRMVTAEDEAMALRNLAAAEKAFQRGDLKVARDAAFKALETFPRQARALELISLCASLEAAGFRQGRPDAK